MGDELVSSSPPRKGGNSDDHRFAPMFFTKVFKEQFPFYLSIGMTPEQYWDDDVTLTRAYYKAYDMRVHRRNEEMWRQGLYNYIALVSAAPAFHSLSKHPEPHKFLEEPLPLTEKDAKDAERRKEEATYRKMMEVFAGRAKAINEKKGGSA